MNYKHVHVFLNFLVLLAINFFIVIPLLRSTLFINDMDGISMVVAFLLSIAYLMLYQIEFSKDEEKSK